MSKAEAMREKPTELVPLPCTKWPESVLEYSATNWTADKLAVVAAAKDWLRREFPDMDREKWITLLGVLTHFIHDNDVSMPTKPPLEFLGKHERPQL